MLLDPKDRSNSIHSIVNSNYQYFEYIKLIILSVPIIWLKKPEQGHTGNDYELRRLSTVNELGSKYLRGIQVIWV